MVCGLPRSLTHKPKVRWKQLYRRTSSKVCGGNRSLTSPASWRFRTFRPKPFRLSELQQSAALEGGIRITYGGSEDDLIANGGLEDIATGYSAALPLRLSATMQEDLPATSYAALGLMTGAADPMMSFPEGTSFSPYSVLRNISSQPISVTP